VAPGDRIAYMWGDRLQHGTEVKPPRGAGAWTGPGVWIASSVGNVGAVFVGQLAIDQAKDHPDARPTQAGLF
jgi:hypothetical protein